MESIQVTEFNLGIFGSISDDSIEEILESWNRFCANTEALLSGRGDISVGSDFVSQVHSLCKHGLESLVQDHFVRSLEVSFERKAASRFWQHFDVYSNVSILKGHKPHNQENGIEQVICKALEDIILEKLYLEQCLLMLIDALQSYKDGLSDGKHNSDAEKSYLLSKYQLMVSSVLLVSLPRQFPEVLHWYFKGRLEELSMLMDGHTESDDDCQDRDYMDLDEKWKSICRDVDIDFDESCFSRRILENSKLVNNIGKVVRDLRSLGFTSMTEDAYASAIFLLLKAKVHHLAGEDYRNSVLEPIKGWIQAVPLKFLHALLAYLGDSVSMSFDRPTSALKSPLAAYPPSSYPGIDTPSEGLIRWKLRLEYFAYETLQDLRIAKLFEIIVDYPDSAPAIEDLKQCLDYTGQYSKLVDSFISALKYRLLTAGASTNDILHQYVSTIKALRTIDPAGLFLEAVGEPIREYLKGRKDTIKCIVTMLTDGTGGNPSSSTAGDSLLEEINREEENQENVGLDDDTNIDDKQAWINAQRWEPDPVEADPMKGCRNRRKVDILGMIVGLIGSKDQLVNEYRVMLAEKLLNKSDYDIESEIRTLELLKIHFGESSMQRCEIMLNDLIDSKRTNSNIKATLPKLSKTGSDVDNELSLDVLDATIISSNFWPTIQDEPLSIPGPVDQLLSDYAQRFHETKTPRKLMWKKSLGVVKLELQFEDKAVQFTVAPLHAAIIMQFQDQTSWTSKNLAATIGVPVDILNRRINFWINKGILTESIGEDFDDHIFSLVDGMADSNKSGFHVGNNEELLIGDVDGERSVVSVEDQLRKEMTVYEKFIMGMLTNFGSMALDRIHNTLKMFCIADPPYDKSLQQLQSFLSGLVSEEKLEIRDGIYSLKKSSGHTKTDTRSSRGAAKDGQPKIPSSHQFSNGDNEDGKNNLGKPEDLLMIEEFENAIPKWKSLSETVLQPDSNNCLSSMLIAPSKSKKTDLQNQERDNSPEAETSSNMSERDDGQRQKPETDEETTMQHLRAKATELLLRGEWKGSLCLSLSNRAEARSRLRDFEQALEDCDLALQFERTHFKTLVSKGKILLSLNKYSTALECFQAALLDPQANGNVETLNGLIDKCKKLEFQSKNGDFDVSDWILHGFRGKCPELGEFVGTVEIKKSEISGRGLFATRNIDAGTLILVTKAIATERCILPKYADDSGENAQFSMWKNFIDKVTESVRKCSRTHYLISTLSNGENEDDLEIPDIGLFRPDLEERNYQREQQLDEGKILSILDVNSLVEDAISAKVLGKNSDYYGLGLWLLPSFINHSCTPNVRRLHIGDHVIVHASRNVKAGEEITFPYFDVLSPLSKRKEMSKTWGFCCECKRCKFERKMHSNPEIEEIEVGLERGLDRCSAIFRLEEYTRMWAVRGKEKAYFRASFWTAFSEASHQSEKITSQWGRRLPAIEAVVDSIVEAVGSDERVLKILIERLKKRRRNEVQREMEIEKVMMLGRGVYGKVVKKQAMRKLLEL
ncbi:hypothetical protein Nepgr_003584 [Nepenthes gracilis]|uniref:Anaphase-promoting complex subunit 2 n=1 Tax=Nepenthes gracilis TaxID=150966 RepID=A0AAD3RZS6_NEPGR|nr:hypothetical protein Nepgr_003584 [Nepenthes gracilis]